MANQASLDQILRLERAVLRAICSGDASQQTREAAIRALGEYEWRGAEHWIVYGAIARLLRSSGESVAEQLPAQATRMGFPDVDWELYLRPHEARLTDIAALIDDLKAARRAPLF